MKSLIISTSILTPIFYLLLMKSTNNGSVVLWLFLSFVIEIACLLSMQISKNTDTW